jgi:hypothetical protein
MSTTFQDDLETVNVSRLRASGAITADTLSVVVSFGQGDDALRREVRVVHCRFPNSGGWSFFVCPVCRRQAALGRRVGKARHREALARCSHEVARGACYRDLKDHHARAQIVSG